MATHKEPDISTMTSLRALRSDNQRATSLDAMGVGQTVYLIVGALFALSPVVVFYDTSAAIVETWYASSAFNHCFLILPIVAYLVWDRRNALTSIVLAPAWAGLPVLMAACLVWLLAHSTETRILQELALVAIIEAVILTIFGRQMVRTFSFPLVYLYFAVPFGDALIPPLQQFTAEFAVNLLREASVPVFVEGNFITVPTGSWYVAEACAGLRYMIASLALGVLFAGLTYRSWSRRIFFVIISLVVPVVANGVRAFGIIFIAYKTNNEIATGIDHLIYGWIFFTFVTFIVLALGMALRDQSRGEEEESHFASASGATHPLRTVILSGIIALVPIAAARAYDSYLAHSTAISGPDIALPEYFGSFHMASDRRDQADVIFAGADLVTQLAYEFENSRVSLHVGYYAYQRPGAEIVSGGHDLTNGWDIVATGTTEFGSTPPLVSARYLRVASGAQRKLIWYWYWVDGRFIQNPYLAKVLEAKGKLIGGPRSAAIIVLESDYTDKEAAADAVLRRFAAMALGDLRKVLEASATP